MPDKEDTGVPSHPRATAELVDHADAERLLLDAWGSGRLPHGWLISGPPGIGKATLAFRFARFVLAGGGDGGIWVAAGTVGAVAVGAGDVALGVAVGGLGIAVPALGVGVAVGAVAVTLMFLENSDVLPCASVAVAVR